MEAWREELYHHGIKGQKWGIRNGPPYPLDENQYSGKKRERVQLINLRAKNHIDDVVTEKAVEEYVKAHPEDYGEYDPNYHSAHNFYYGSSRERIAEVERIKEEIMKRPDFQNLLNESYKQAIEQEGSERIKDGMFYVGSVMALLATAGAGLAIRDKIKK